MKVVSSKQMAYIESQAYRDGSLEEEFMEEAGKGIAHLVHEFIERGDYVQSIVLLCGKGNNAGDAYVAGIHLLHLGYDVLAFQTVPISVCSALCRQNHARFLSEGGFCQEVLDVEEIAFPLHGVIIDGLFGTGFKGKIEEPIASIVEAANHSRLPIISVDIPSGLNGETGEVNGVVINAAETAFLGLPKTGFFLLDGWNEVGKLHYVDFGLPAPYIDSADFDFIMLTQELVRPLLPPIKRNRHKYERGLVVGLAGSPGMPGAAILSSWSSLQGGAGIVRLLHPDGMQNELSASPYELIKVAYGPNDYEEIITAMNKGTGLFVGPGIGRSDKTKELLKQVLPHISKPCVIDADALTILSEADIPFPEQSVLTPHKGELEKLLKLSPHQTLDMKFLKICQAYADNKRITLLLKGGPTFIFHPDEPIMVNPGGDPGMATAGSGDVLTGLIAALLSQGMTTHHAAILGVYLHALAGEYAAFNRSSYCMTASDILDYFPSAYTLNPP